MTIEKQIQGLKEIQRMIMFRDNVDYEAVRVIEETIKSLSAIHPYKCRYILPLYYQVPKDERLRIAKKEIINKVAEFLQNSDLLDVKEIEKDRATNHHIFEGLIFLGKGEIK